MAGTAVKATSPEKRNPMKPPSPPTARLYSERIDRAICLAGRAHAKKNQMRKGTDIPYLAHPAHVARILDKAGYAEDVVVAAYLHDVLEDTDVPPSAIRDEFGERVLDLVLSVTEKKSDDGKTKRPWRIRKQEQIDHLRKTTDLESVALKAADALHNARSIVSDFHREGPAVWARFSKDATPSDQAWRYETVARLVKEKLGDTPLARELEQAAEDVGRIVGGAAGG